MWNHLKSFLGRKPNQQSQNTAPEPVEEVIIIDVALMNAAYPDRSAGRWCASCEQWGTHHTDAHNDFAKAALATAS